MITPERRQRIKDLFNSALERPSAERAQFLDAACESDESLRAEVESLLSAHDEDESFLSGPAYELVAETLAADLSGLKPGEQIGRYIIHSRLGEGGMGEVYLARDPQHGRDVAIKLLTREFARDEQRVRRFEQEARAALALNHPNVCIIYEVGLSQDGRHFMAMEFIDGVTLRRRMSQKRFTLKEALDVARQVAWALEAAHAAGIIHRDIKPENIMLRRDGYIKILDFGIAKLGSPVNQQRRLHEASTVAQMHTTPGTFMGTVKYMSPEQLREQNVDERTDIWSLGVVLYEMVSGFTPFEASSTNETIAVILEKRPARLDLDPELAGGFRELLEKALSKPRRDRYQTMREFAVALRAMRQQLSSESVPEVPEVETLRLVDASRAEDEKHDATLFSKFKLQAIRTADSVVREIRQHKTAAVFGGLAAALLGLLFLRPPWPRPQPPVSASPGQIKIEPLTNSGKSVYSAISPDGKMIAHAENENGGQSLLITGLATRATSVLVPPGNFAYRGITFSPDNNYLYFTRTEQSSSGVLYQLALPGSPARKIKEGVDGPIAFSPSGDRFSFVRSIEATGVYSLMTAAVDGSNEHVIVSRQQGNTLSIYGPAWSPDGDSIVIAAGSWDGGYRSSLLEVPVSGGQEKLIGGPRWFSVRQIAWLPGKRGLIISAKEKPLDPFQLWRVSYPQGEVTKLTSDLAEYDTVSLAANTIVTLRTEQAWKIWYLSVDAGDTGKSIRSGVGRSYGLNWSGDGKVLFAAMAGNNQNIFRIDADGSNQVQLTVNAGDNYMPAATADSRYVVFASNRSGKFNIWRINADGSEPRQLTFSDGNFYPSCSADSRWVLFDNQTGPTTTIWKVPIDGGEARQLTDKPTRMPIVSPDNQFIACRYHDAGGWVIAVLPFEGGAPVRLAQIPIMDWQTVRWSPDGRSLTYIDVADGTSNIWSYELATGSRKQLTNFKSDQIFTYGWSSDQKQVACERGNRPSDVTLITNAW